MEENKKLIHGLYDFDPSCDWSKSRVERAIEANTDEVGQDVAPTFTNLVFNSLIQLNDKDWFIVFKVNFEEYIKGLIRSKDDPYMMQCHGYLDRKVLNDLAEFQAMCERDFQLNKVGECEYVFLLIIRLYSVINTSIIHDFDMFLVEFFSDYNSEVIDIINN